MITSDLIAFPFASCLCFCSFAGIILTRLVGVIIQKEVDGPHSIGSQLFLNFIQVWKELAYLGGHHAAEVHSSPAFGAVARCAADVCKIVANDELKAIDVKELKSAAINFNDLALLLTQFCELTKKHKFGNTVNVKPKDVVAKLKDAKLSA